MSANNITMTDEVRAATVEYDGRWLCGKCLMYAQSDYCRRCGTFFEYIIIAVGVEQLLTDKAIDFLSLPQKLIGRGSVQTGVLTETR